MPAASREGGRRSRREGPANASPPAATTRKRNLRRPRRAVGGEEISRVGGARAPGRRTATSVNSSAVDLERLEQTGARANGPRQRPRHAQRPRPRVPRQAVAGRFRSDPTPPRRSPPTPRRRPLRTAPPRADRRPRHPRAPAAATAPRRPPPPRRAATGDRSARRTTRTTLRCRGGDGAHPQRAAVSQGRAHTAAPRRNRKVAGAAAANRRSMLGVEEERGWVQAGSSLRSTRLRRRPRRPVVVLGGGLAPLSSAYDADTAARRYLGARGRAAACCSPPALAVLRAVRGSLAARSARLLKRAEQLRRRREAADDESTRSPASNAARRRAPAQGAAQPGPRRSSPSPARRRPPRRRRRPSTTCRQPDRRNAVVLRARRAVALPGSFGPKVTPESRFPG